MSHQVLLFNLKGLAAEARFQNGVLLKQSPPEWTLTQEVATESYRLTRMAAVIEDAAQRLEKEFEENTTRAIPTAAGSGGGGVPKGQGAPSGQERRNPSRNLQRKEGKVE